jgi:peptidoglycan hydrolase-like protein with peptidoglycan-binding domain
LTTRNYVKSVQAILWVNGKFSSTTSIDGVFGSGTTTALKGWQAEHGLTQDGCAGYYTWNSMQNLPTASGNRTARS